MKKGSFWHGTLYFQLRHFNLQSTVITQKRRFELLKRTLECYFIQVNVTTELIIVHDETDEFSQLITDHLEGRKTKRFRIIQMNSKSTLGQMRNIAIQHAAGKYLCQWDDDDLCHPLRLETQLQAICNSHSVASVLDSQYHYFVKQQEIYIRTHATIPGSILFLAGLVAIYPETGPGAERGEDWSFLQQIRQLGPVAIVPNRPELYVRLFHGDNTWDLAHHIDLVTRKGMPSAQLRVQEPLIREHMTVFGITGVSVRDKDSIAFAIP